MRIWKITVTGEATHPEDVAEGVTGEFEIQADNEEHALDEFHETYPIACLDDFEIDIEEVWNAAN